MHASFRSAYAACLAVAALLGGGPGASAASRPTLSQLETVAIQRAEGDDETGSSIDAIAASLDDGEGLRLNFLRSLFTDPASRRHTEDWLRTLPKEFDLHSEWARRFRTTMAAAAKHLRSEEVEFIFARFVAPAAAFDNADCVRLVDPATPRKELALAFGVTRPAVAEFYRILNRIYIAATTNETPPVAASRSAVEAARLEAMLSVPATARARLLSVTKDSQEPTAASDCVGMIAMALAFKDVPGESGQLVRRDLVNQMLEPAVVPNGRNHATTSVKGAATPHFEPGSVSLEYPLHAARAGIQGTMTVKIWIDDEGRATRVRTIQRAFNLPSAKLADGTEIPVEEMFDPVVSVFYKSGRFMRRFKDGVPQAYVVEVPLNWKLQD